MADSRKRIAGAFLIGSALVAGAFLISRNSSTYAPSGTLSVASVERGYIPIEDSNQDGVPNWQEALQQTDPIILEELATSTYERPTTFTGKFALNFFENYLRSKMYGVFGDSQDEVIAESTQALIRETQDVLFVAEDLSVVQSSTPEILRAYGNEVAKIVLSQHTGEDNEAIILQDSLRYEDKERLNDLDPIAASYVTIVKKMLELPVPQDYAKQHLDLLNAYNAIREDVSGMQKVYEDPMYTFVRMKRYPDDVLGMYNALTSLFDALSLERGAQWEEGEPVPTLRSMLETI